MQNLPQVWRKVYPAVQFHFIDEYAGAQACHELVPPDALAPVLRQLVDAFVHDRARPEVMTLGLKTVRELCARTPLVMTPELLQVHYSQESPCTSSCGIATASWARSTR